MIEYTLTLTRDQAATVLKAVELLMRLKINQPEEVARAVMPENYWKDGKIDSALFDDHIQRRDRANVYIRAAFGEIFQPREPAKKDEEWYRLYNVYQALRYQRHLAEHPNSTGVDSYPPIAFTDEPIPKCEWRDVK